MKQLIKYFGDSVIGVSSGFDRLVFQGMIRPIMYPGGAMSFFRRRRIMFKDAGRWVQEQTKCLVSAVEEWSKRECGGSIVYLPSTRIRKEAEARRKQQDKKVTVGPIGVWSCVEAGGSYRLMPAQGAPKLRYVQTRCKHLYTYLDHPDFGFMSIRMQTWFPYRIQIAVNGREWLARQLEKAGVGFARVGNKIHEVEDFSAMQPLLDKQLRTDWCSMLDSFVPIAFPTIRSALDNELLHYSWNVWQSEWASDFLFKDRTDLDEIIDAVVRHAFIGGHPERLLRYFDRPTRNDGQVRSNSRRPLKTTVTDFDEGYRVRHWLESNSVKLYNEGNVLRIETTVNDPYAFRVYRRKQGAPKDAAKQLLPMRKGVADTTLRALVSQDINNRFADHLATMRSDTPLRAILQNVTSRKRKRGRSVRALEPTGKDIALLSAIADPRLNVGGFQNKHIRLVLASDPRYRGKTDKQRSGMTTRFFRLLRDHGVIRRLPKSRKYQLTANGRQLVTAVLAALAASTEELTKIAA
jgi:hypothetical protein